MKESDKKYIISVNEENKGKVNQIIEIYTFTNLMEDKLKKQLNIIEKNNEYLNESLISIFNDFKMIITNLQSDEYIL
jgi:hypothetical protein